MNGLFYIFVFVLGLHMWPVAVAMADIHPRGLTLKL